MSSLVEMYNQGKTPILSKRNEREFLEKLSVHENEMKVENEKMQNEMQSLKQLIKNMPVVSPSNDDSLKRDVETLKKSRIVDEYNAFVVSYNEQMEQINSCIVDMSRRMAVLESQ